MGSEQKNTDRAIKHNIDKVLSNPSISVQKILFFDLLKKGEQIPFKKGLDLGFKQGFTKGFNKGQDHLAAKLANTCITNTYQRGDKCKNSQPSKTP